MQFGRDSSRDHAGVSLSHSFVVPISIAAAGPPSGVGGGEVGVTVLPESLRFAPKTRRVRDMERGEEIRFGKMRSGKRRSGREGRRAGGGRGKKRAGELRAC